MGSMGFRWAEGFVRVPADGWTDQPIESLALKYDTVENHGWYRNLDATISELFETLHDGDVLIDYSAGTGILEDRLLRARRLDIGVALVDASPKFLRLALEKFRDDPRFAFRLIRFRKDLQRLEFVDEVFDVPADVLVSTNAVHLYYDLDDTLRSWTRALRRGGTALVQSGNIRNPEAPPDEWIIDETVEALHEVAARLAQVEPRWRSYRPVLEDRARMEAYTQLRRKVFLPVRPLSHYLVALSGAGFEIERTQRRTIEARVDEWRDFLSVYHEGVLGWVGGTVKIDGRAPDEEAVADRLALIARSLEVLFAGAETFPCCWTYVTARRR